MSYEAEKKILAVRAFVASDDRPGPTGSDMQLLREAKAAVSAIEKRDRWVSVGLPPTLPLNSGRVFKFRNLPPPRPASEVAAGAGRSLRSLKQWGDLDLEDDEQPCISSLPEFEGTDFLARLSRDNSSSETSTSRKRKQFQSSTDDEFELDERDSKRIRSSLAPVGEVPDIYRLFKPYRKSPLTPYRPYTEETIKILFDDNLARGAWVIPLQGDLPWSGSGAWGARIVSTLAEMPSAGAGATIPGTIIWTKPIIKKFWDDLCTIRQNNTLGPLTLTFGFGQLRSDSESHSHSNADSDAAAIPIQSEGEGERHSSTRTRFACIKIHHNLCFSSFPNSLYVRAVLDSWRPKFNSASADGDHASASAAEKAIQPRPLRGVKLTLVDEDDNAIGVC